MSEKPLSNGNVLCKYDQYLQPGLKKTLYDMPFPNYSKKLSMHKQRLSGILPPSTIKKAQQTCILALPQSKTKMSLEVGYHANSSLIPQHTHQKRKSQTIRLQNLFPKGVTIKFEQVLDYIPNNRQQPKPSRSPKLSKTISPMKIFQLSQNKFYTQLIDQKRRSQQREKKSSNKIDSLFNIKSINMIRKITDLLPFEEQKPSNISLKRQKKQKKSNNKYDRMFKKQTDYSVEYEKQNPPKLDYTQKINVKLSLKNIRRLEESQNLTLNKAKPNRLQLLPLAELKTSQKCHQQYAQNKNLLLLTQHKPQKNNIRSSSMLVNKRKSKQLNPMVFSLNSDIMNSSFSNSTNSKLFDHRPLVSRKPDSIFDEKIVKYLRMLKINAQLLGIEINFPQSYSRNQFCFYVGKGNNSKLVREMLKKRWWLGSCEDKKDLNKNNIIWTQLKDKSYYLMNESPTKDSTTQQTKQMPKSKETKQSLQPQRLVMHNHFEQNEFLGNKKALFYNMKAYYLTQTQNVFQYLPLTFHITSLSDESWTSFISHFNQVKQQDPTAKNIWILKPGENSNRGNGITVHESIQSIKSIVSQTGQNQKSIRTYILQKYIEKPFLYNKRKFDIRCYMLLVRVKQKIKGFWYKEGYIRTSGYEFTLQDCKNSFVHLTNDAVQQNCDNYGKFQDKNKLSYESFQKYLDTNYNNITGLNCQGDKKYDLEKQVLPKLRKVCIDSIKASYKYLGKWRQSLPTFQLFGLDFMIDEQFNPWLIEINTNPCLQTEGRVLQKVIVPLLDNVFKLTIDCLIPPPLNWSNSNKHLLSKSVDKNLFELVFDQTLEERINERNNLIKQLPMNMIGQIDEDNEVYQEEQV